MEDGEVTVQVNEEDDDDILNENSTPFVDWPRFNILMGVFIMGNAFMMGAELDVGDPDLPYSERLPWYAAEFGFCVVFTLELFARLYFYRLRFFANLANILDFILVGLQIAETWIIVFLFSDTSLRIFSIFRLLRMLKLLRFIRLLTIFKELWLIVHGLYESLKTLGWVCVLLVLDLYLFAVFLTSYIGHRDDLYDAYYLSSNGWDHEYHFGTVLRSMFTLLQVLTLDGWAHDIARHVNTQQPYLKWVFLFFLIITSFGLISMIVGVVVESVLSEANSSEKKVAKKKDADRFRILEHLRVVFEIADIDKSGTITLEEVRLAIQNPEVHTKLCMIGFPVSDPGEIFMLLDVDHCGELTIDEFIKGCMRLKGDAKSKDLLEVQVNVQTLGKHIAKLDEKFQLVQDKISLLDRKTKKMADQSSAIFADPAARRRFKMAG